MRKAFIQQGADDLCAKQAIGQYNPEFFEPYQRLNHDALMNDVDAFDKAYPKTPSLPAKAWYYFKLGGPSALAKYSAPLEAEPLRATAKIDVLYSKSMTS